MAPRDGTAGRPDRHSRKTENSDSGDGKDSREDRNRDGMGTKDARDGRDRDWRDSGDCRQGSCRPSSTSPRHEVRAFLNQCLRKKRYTLRKLMQEGFVSDRYKWMR